MALCLKARRRAALVAAALAGCAEWGGGTTGAINSWNGARYEEVAAQWGTPTRSGSAEGGAVTHTWLSPYVRFGIFGGNAGSGVAASFPLPGMGPDPAHVCERTLTFRDGRVVHQEWNGPDTICAPYKRR